MKAVMPRILSSGETQREALSLSADQLVWPCMAAAMSTVVFGYVSLMTVVRVSREGRQSALVERMSCCGWRLRTRFSAL